LIRRYLDSDLDEVLDAWYEASMVAHSFLSPEFFVTERQLMAEQWLPSAETYVCERDGRVVGFISLVGDEVGGLFVHPEHQGRGAGRALMDHARSSRSSLELEVFEENPIGRRFYDAYGFEPIGSRFDPDTGHTQIRLHLG
jgi:putative acetyltransferase